MSILVRFVLHVLKSEKTLMPYLQQTFLVAGFCFVFLIFVCSINPSPPFFRLDACPDMLHFLVCFCFRLPPSLYFR